MHTHTHRHIHTHTHLIVDSIRCVLVRCPLQNTRVPCLTDLLQGCKVVIKSNTAVFTGGARTLLICAQWANCTDRQTDRQEVPEGNSYMAVNSSCIWQTHYSCRATHERHFLHKLQHWQQIYLSPLPPTTVSPAVIPAYTVSISLYTVCMHTCTWEGQDEEGRRIIEMYVPLCWLIIAAHSTHTLYPDTCSCLWCNMHAQMNRRTLMQHIYIHIRMHVLMYTYTHACTHSKCWNQTRYTCSHCRTLQLFWTQQ